MTIARKAKATALQQGWPCLKQPGGCPCRCHAVARGRMKGNKVNQDEWSKEEEETLVDCISKGLTYKEISEVLAEKSKYDGQYRPRTIAAVRSRITVLGLSVRKYWLTLSEAARVFHVSHYEVQRWRTLGHLIAKPWGNGTWWRFMVSDIEAFVDAWSGILFQPDQLKGGIINHQAELRGLYERAIVAARKNRTLLDQLHGTGKG